jgi:hypothetical protein
MGLQLTNQALWVPGRQLKPIGVPRINWSHPLARDLICYFFDTGDAIVELVRGWSSSTLGVPVSYGDNSPFGASLRWLGTQDTAIWFDTANRDPRLRTLNSVSGFTAACACYPTTEAVANTTASATDQGIFSRVRINGNAGTDSMHWFAFHLYRIAAGNNQFALAIADSNGVISRWCAPYNAASFTGLASVGNYHTLTMTMNGAGTQSQAYGDGYNITGTAFTACTLHNGTDTTDHIVFGNKTTTTQANNSDIPYPGGYIFWGACWDRELSHSDHALLHNDPYCLLLPGNERMPGLISLQFAVAQVATDFEVATSPTIGTPVIKEKNALVADSIVNPPPTIDVAQWVTLWLSNRVLDGGLAVLDAEVNEIWLVSALPVVAPTYADALAAKLGSVATTFGAITSVGSSRRVATPAITSGVTTAVGAAHRWAAVDTVNSRLLAYGRLTGDLTTDTAKPWSLDPIAIVKDA